MLKNYFIITLRNFHRNKALTLINVAGLGLSMACCVAIYAFVRHEYSFDSFHSNADRIYRVVFQERGPIGTSYAGYTSFPVARALRNDFPELEHVTQVYNREYALIKVPGASSSDKIFEEEEMAYADEHFLKTFDYNLLAGQAGHLLTTPDEVVLSKKLAEKFFGKEVEGYYDQLIGKILIINKEPYQISAILEDIPRNTNVTFSLLLPFRAFERSHPQLMDNWYNTFSNNYTFVTLPKGYDPQQIEAQLVPFKNKYLNEETAARQTYYLQPLREVHTDETYEGTIYATPHLLILAFITMGIIVLLTACINFINLATAFSIKRAKEIGIRKALGSLKYQLIVQFMGETFLLTLLASLIAVLLAERFIDTFNQYLSFIIDFGLKLDSTVIYFLVALCILITFLAGYYPAHILAGYRPAEALKQAISHKGAGFSGKFSLRKTLVVTQFIISQLLLIGTIIVAMQMRYIHNRDLGFTREGILVVFIPEEDRQKLDVFRDKLTEQAQIGQVTFSAGPPVSSSNFWTIFHNPAAGSTEKYGIERKSVDAQYIPAYEIKLLAGRNLREDDFISFTEDSVNYYNAILNEKAIHMLGYEHPEEALGQEFITDDKNRTTIVGVVENFTNATLKEEVHPCMLFYGTWTRMASIKLNLQQASGTLALIRDTWEDLYPDYFFKSMTQEEYFRFGAFYIIEDLMYQAFKIFAVLSIFIGCMGLYGLVSFLALQRQKEIGIRKTLGASVSQIVYMFSKEFILLVLLAFLIAAPLGYFAMQAWLDTFVYRIDLNPVYFLLALLVSVVVAWITVGYKSVKAATANPVESLRNE